MMRRVLLGGALITLDALWLGAWLSWAAAVGGPGARSPGIASLLLMGWLALLTTRALVGLHLDLAVIRTLAISAACLTVLAVARATLYSPAAVPDVGWLGQFAADLARGGAASGGGRLLALAGALLWWRGTRYGQAQLRPSHARRVVSFAVLSFAVEAAVIRISTPVNLTPLMLAALVASLAALALARIDDASVGYGGTAADFGPVWVGALAGAIGLVIALAAGLAPFLSAEAAHRLLAVVAPLLGVVRNVGALLLLKLTAATFAAMRLFYELLVLLAGSAGEPFALPTEPLPPPTQPPVFDASGAAGRWLVPLRVALVALVIAGLMALIARALRSYEDPRTGEHRAERRSNLSARRVAADLVRAARSLADEARSVFGAPARLAPGVRGLYSKLLTLMAERGHGRQNSQTPYEYEPVVVRAVEGVTSEIKALTEAYVLERYGARQLDAESLARLREAWHRIQAAAGGSARA